MPLNEIPKFFHPEIRHLIDFAMEDAWQELRKEGLADAASVRGKLATTIVALAAIGETDPTKLKRFALHAARGALSRERSERSAAEEATRSKSISGLDRRTCKVISFHYGSALTFAWFPNNDEGSPDVGVGAASG
jgi:hypothetical protein